MADNTISFDSFIPGLIKTSLARDAVKSALSAIEGGWDLDVTEGTPCLGATFLFTDFNACMVFADRVARLADTYDHHPELVIRYGTVTVKWWTHTAKGVAANDVFMAMRTTELST